MGNYGNPVPQDVCFIHVVCGENDGAACRAQAQGRGTGETRPFSLTAVVRTKEILARVGLEERSGSLCGQEP